MIRTENTLLAAGQPDLPPLEGEGSWAQIQVSDNGMGMAQSVRDRVFEPYFTTKAVGKGSGLGMSTVFGIVEQHGGVIDISSELGAGSIVRIFLPQIADT